VAGALSFVLTLFCGLIAYDTLFRDLDVIEMRDGTATGWAGPNGMVVKYDRGFYVKADGEGDMLRKIVCTCPRGDREEWDMMPIHRVFTKGEYPAISRYIETPMQVPPGSSCTLFVYGVWRPAFAINSKMQLLDSFDFKVTVQPSVIP
jgi:hypothetical protein